MQSLSQLELRKLGVMMENFMAGFLTFGLAIGKRCLILKQRDPVEIQMNALFD
jgi:hypothetical protein